MASIHSGEAFDYIVVGGGTAGLVVASRLSEDPTIRVLVVEAGADHRGDPSVTTPGFLTTLYGKNKYDWNYESTPQAHVNGRTQKLARGKGLGGSSTINFMAVLYPSRACIDLWAKLGNRGWNWKDLEPYYHRAATRSPPQKEHRSISRIAARGYDGSKAGSGPLRVSYSGDTGALNSAWMDSLASLGFGPSDQDPASGNVMGAFQNLVTIDPVTKTRSYAASAYLGEEVRIRTNLVVLTETLVQKIHLDNQDTAVATGVQLQAKDGSITDVRARREVVLAAGAIGSPQLLEASGIGRAGLISKHGISVVVDLPGVGENLQDHPLVGQAYQIRKGIPSLDMFRDHEFVQEAVRQYETDRQGPLGANSASAAYLPLVDVDGRLSTEAKAALLDKYVPDTSGQRALIRDMYKTLDVPAFSWMIFPGQINTEGESQTDFGSYLEAAKPGNHVTVLNALAHPFSRGASHIKSPDVSIAPTIDVGFLSHPADREILARGAMFAEKTMSTDPLRSTVLLPGCGRIPDAVPSTLENATETVKHGLMSNMHLCGTCAMQPRDQDGVVDDKLVVYGTRNLRVVDASIFPLVPLGNIQLTVYAVAEKAVDIIKAAAH